MVKLPMATVAVIGQSMAGKTSLIKTLQNPDNKRKLTGRGVDAATDQTTKVFDIKEVKFGKTTLQFVDFGGQEIYQLAYRMTLKRNCLPVVVVSLEMYKKLKDEVGENEAVRYLFFDWLSHLYLAYSDLSAPQLVLTHKDVFLLEESKQLRASFLQSCGQVLRKAVEEGILKRPFKHTSRDTLFLEANVYEIGNDSEDWVEFDRLKMVLFEQSERFANKVPKSWQEVEEKLKAYPGTYISMAELQNGLTGNLAPIKDHVDVILTYLYNVGKLLTFSGEHLKDLILYKIRAVTEMIYALYSHDEDHSYPTILHERQSDYFMTHRSYEDHYRQFRETGAMNQRLFNFLLSAKTKFNNSAEMAVAVEILKSFHLLEGPLKFNGVTSYILPYFCVGYVTDPTSVPHSSNLNLMVEFEFKGLSLPRYVNYQMNTELLRIFTCGQGIEVKQNGVSFETGACHITLLHNFNARKSSICISMAHRHICEGWKNLKTIINTLVCGIMDIWSGSRIVCTMFCPHCLLKNDPHPRRIVSPVWGHNAEMPTLPGETALAADPLALEGQCKTDGDVPQVLLGSRDSLLDEELTTLEDYVLERAPTITTDLMREVENSPVKTQDGGAPAAEDDEAGSLSDEENWFAPLCGRIIEAELKPTRKRHIRQLFHDVDKVYKMSSPVRGRALVINNFCSPGTGSFENGKGEREIRKRSQTDLQNITRMLTLLKFQVMSLNDLTAVEIMSEIRRETMNPDHSDYGMFMLVLMTCGDGDDVIYGSDNNPVSLSAVYKLMTSQKFPGMRGKPKAVITHTSTRDWTSQVPHTVRNRQDESVEDLIALQFCFRTTSLEHAECESPFIGILVDTVLKHSCHRDIWDPL